MPQSQPQPQQRSTKKKSKSNSATHTEMAREYIARRWEDTTYMRSAWYRYDAGVWLKQHDLALEQEVWNLLEEYEHDQRCRPTATIHSSVAKRIRARLFVPDEQVDHAQNLINLTNGVYNLDDGILYAHKPDYYLTTQLPFDYTPRAEAPLWDLFVFTTFVKPNSTEHDPELASFVQEAMGYSLTTSVEHHVSFWCFGEGSNGKGTLFHVLKGLAGSAAIPLNVGLLRREQYQLADLAGKRVAMCSEAGATDSLVEDALVKALIGGDLMQVRQIHRPPFSLQPMAKLWWAMNKLPAVADTTYGFWRRMRVIPFNRQFKEQERILDLKPRLTQEFPGIFKWAMEGLKRLLDRGRFVIPSQVKQATDKYEKESNPVALFIEDVCIVGKDKRIQSSILYSNYKDWCKNNGYRALSRVRFKAEMERLGYFAKRLSAGVFFEYVTLKLRIP
jgi:putative DNA primase/helicase